MLTRTYEPASLFLSSFMQRGHRSGLKCASVFIIFSRSAFACLKTDRRCAYIMTFLREVRRLNSVFEFRDWRGFWGDNVVGIATRLQSVCSRNRGLHSRHTQESFLRNVQTSSEAHAPSYTTGNSKYYPRNKLTGAENVHVHRMLRLRIRGANLPLSHMPSWSSQKNSSFTFMWHSRGFIRGALWTRRWKFVTHERRKFVNQLSR